MKDGHFSSFPCSGHGLPRITYRRTDVQANHHRSCSAAAGGTKPFAYTHACTLSGEPKLDHFNHAAAGNWQPKSAAGRRRNELPVLPVLMAMVPVVGAAFNQQSRKPRI